MQEKKSVAIVLAAGQGKRMQTKTAKQFLEIENKPVLYYSLQAFEKSNVDETLIVTSEGEISYVKEQIVAKYGLKKVSAVVAGGKERYHSVANGLHYLSDICSGEQSYEIVLIHDGARPLVQPELINELIKQTRKYKACVTGTPVKDTVKLADADGFCDSTPNRNLVWTVQTPQTFTFELASRAYEMLLEKEEELLRQGIAITDDAMVVQQMMGQKVKLVMGDYKNMKLTTPEDLAVARLWLSEG